MAAGAGRTPPADPRSGGGAPDRRITPAERSHAETFFYVKQIHAATPILLHLRDGSELRGVLEWYDRAGLRLNLEGGDHLIVRKSAVAWIQKLPEES